MKLIVGLGNPGKQYLQTRHNIGYVVIDFLLQELKLEINQEKFNGIFVKNNNIILAKPITFMNLSGSFVQQIAHYYKIKPEDILIIHDDMDYKIGKFSIKKTGSSGGQNGVKDIIQKLNTQNFNRIKIGIGRNLDGSEHVLGKFTMAEKKSMKDSLRTVLDATTCFMNNDIDYVMNKYNRRK
jgi:PTH1 family peptidyl-tRNA hydrolase